MILRILKGFWKCHSIIVCILSSFSSIARSTQSFIEELLGLSLSSSFLFGKVFESLKSFSSLPSSDETGAAFSPSITFVSRVSSLTKLSVFSSLWPESLIELTSGSDFKSDSTVAEREFREMIGSHPIGLASGFLRRYCLRKAVCQFSVLSVA